MADKILRTLNDPHAINSPPFDCGEACKYNGIASLQWLLYGK